MKTFAIIIFLAVAGCFGQEYAQQTVVHRDDETIWSKIGETLVNFEHEREEISLAPADKFLALKFKVMEEAIELHKLEIYYTNGDKQEIPIIETLQSQGESSIIDLNGGERTIQKVVFEYKSYPNEKNKRAKVELWGMKNIKM